LFAHCKVKRLNSKVTSTNEKIIELKAGCEKSKQFVETFDYLMKDGIFTTDCIKRCESYWSVAATLEGLHQQGQQLSEQQSKLDKFDEELIRAKESNDKIRSVIQAAEERICSNTEKKKSLNNDMVQYKQTIYSLQLQLNDSRSVRGQVSSQLSELTDLKNASSSALESLINSLKAKNSLIGGLLLQLASPAVEEYGGALLSVLGRKALKTVVVETRECAVHIADSLRKHKLSCSTILIANELGDRGDNSLRDRSADKLIPLFDAISIANKISRVVYNMLLSGWYLFLGSGIQYKNIRLHPIQANVVCLDGCQYLADGEISLSFSNSAKSTAVQGRGKRQANSFDGRTASLSWPTETTAAGDELFEELQLKLERITAVISTTEGKVTAAALTLEGLENEWRCLDSLISEDIKTIQAQKKSVRKLPQCPVNDRDRLKAEQKQYNDLLNKKQNMAEEISSSTALSEPYRGEKLADLLLQVTTHRHQLMFAQSELRMLEDDSLSSADLLSGFITGIRQKEEEIASEKELLVKSKDSLLELKEACGMALEDCTCSSLRIKSDSERLRSIDTDIKQVCSKP
jgi:chromosome segregation ATPase